MDGIAKFVGYVFLFLVGVGIYNQWKDGKTVLFSKADCRVVGKNAFENTFIINGNFDYGYTVEGTVKNVGKGGEILIHAKLYTSEGDFERSQKLSFSGNEQRTVRFQFHEPTITAMDVRYGVFCSPGSK